MIRGLGRLKKFSAQNGRYDESPLGLDCYDESCSSSDEEAEGVGQDSCEVGNGGILTTTTYGDEAFQNASQDDIGGQDSEKTAASLGLWNAFQVEPTKVDSGSTKAMEWAGQMEKLLKVVTVVVTCLTILASSVASKCLTSFMISQISMKPVRRLKFCNRDGIVFADPSEQLEVQWNRYPDPASPYEAEMAAQLEIEQVAWIWCLVFAFAAPEVFTFLRCFRKVFLKQDVRREQLAGTKADMQEGQGRWLKLPYLAFVLAMETLHVSGICVLTFVAMPHMDVLHSVLLGNCLAAVPGLLLMTTRTKRAFGGLPFLAADALAVAFQLSGPVALPLLQDSVGWGSKAWAIPVGLTLTSFGWWECFVSEDGWAVSRWMNRVRTSMINRTRSTTYLALSLWKVLVFFAGACLVTSLTGQVRAPGNLFGLFKASFGSHNFTLHVVSSGPGKLLDVLGLVAPEVMAGTNRAAEQGWEELIVSTASNWPVVILVLQILSSYVTYIMGKFACKVKIQKSSFSVPLTLTMPVSALLIIGACVARSNDECAFHSIFPDYQFFDCQSSSGEDICWQHLAEGSSAWLWGLWTLWLLSQLWITQHIWRPVSEKLAPTELLFGKPFYCSFFLEQSLTLNRRRDGRVSAEYGKIVDEMRQRQRANEVLTRFLPGSASGAEAKVVLDKITGASLAVPSADGTGGRQGSVREKDKVTRIYACATMWHENREEMMEMLKSLFRIDIDYSSRRLARKYLRAHDPDYYEWETHILFDDAFQKPAKGAKGNEKPLNSYVKGLIACMDEAATLVHGEQKKVRPPKKIPTPYGGRLIWTLHGKTKIVCHLKDKEKIRRKKRWSQVMYMYYLLGYKLIDNPKLNDFQKELRARNTFLLALDGDIDFQPPAVTRLVDKMKKNPNLGAACGRILPTGSGFMVWYQTFEYAIGHWLQKATEHVMGCVLCSPGCFSLFRGRAIMDTNVMRKYTTNSERPLDFVQYDQGEDRWLCTLLLQRGWRIEYSAASDSYTACPENFNEFFNQRRRWMPSTIANIYDLLSDSGNVIRMNPDISRFYILYQMMLMVGTVLGPGTIFLMLVGAFNAAFKISNWNSFILNLVPIIGFMLVCYLAKSKVQLLIAQVLSAVYALVMMAVLVGILLQISEDGLLSPTTMAIFLVGGSFILAGVVHPQEFYCLPYGVIYYITIPAMYLLLVIYSIFNLNDVSWGTRDVTETAAPSTAAAETGASLEAKVEEAKALAKASSKNKGEEKGLLSFLLNQQQGSGADGRAAEKGGLDFSLGNLFRCMCFTHEDPSNDTGKHLGQISSNVEQLSERLKKIEHVLEHGPSRASRGLFSFRRNKLASLAASLRTLDNTEEDRPPQPGGSALSQVPAEPSAAPTGRKDMASSGWPKRDMAEGDDSTEDEEVSDSEDEAEDIVRDDLINPFWAEDRALSNARTRLLKKEEILFWKGLIGQYLESEDKKFDTVQEKEAHDKKKADQKLSLKSLRDQMVFSFFMLNSIFVLVVFLLQQEKDTINVDWPIDPKVSISYSGPKNPTVEISLDYLKLEPIGFVFIIFFAVVIMIQIIGMLIHRFETLSHIVSDTRMQLFPTATNKDFDSEGSPKGYSSSMLEVAKEFQKGDKDSFSGSSQQDTITAINTRLNAGMGPTVRHLTKKFNQTKGRDLSEDLEENFKRQLVANDQKSLRNSKNPVLKKLSMRRGTLGLLENHRMSFLVAEERRKSSNLSSAPTTVSASRTAVKGVSNEGFENDHPSYPAARVGSIATPTESSSLPYSRSSKNFEYLPGLPNDNNLQYR